MLFQSSRVLIWATGRFLLLLPTTQVAPERRDPPCPTVVVGARHDMVHDNALVRRTNHLLKKCYTDTTAPRAPWGAEFNPTTSSLP